MSLGLMLSACAYCLPGAERREIMAGSAQTGEISYPASPESTPKP